MPDFETNDIEALEAKLLALELTEPERAALDTLVSHAAQTSDEVAGYTGAESLKIGSLSFLSGIQNRAGAGLPIQNPAGAGIPKHRST